MRCQLVSRRSRQQHRSLHLKRACADAYADARAYAVAPPAQALSPNMVEGAPSTQRKAQESWPRGRVPGRLGGDVGAELGARPSGREPRRACRTWARAPAAERRRRAVGSGRRFGLDAQQSCQSLHPCFDSGFAALHHVDKQGQGMCIVSCISGRVPVLSLFIRRISEQIPLQGLVLRVAVLIIAGVEEEAQAGEVVLPYIQTSPTAK
mmetsp:Transcript_66917/g.180933  ORF Transcript_66917/g.180933 Transcript_66917/m.180933 type:complete len:208 (+) Transcript_66917:226-849(+)